MAQGLLNDPPVTAIAGADLTGMEGRFVKYTTAGDNTVILCVAGEVGVPLLLGASTGRAVALYPAGSVAKMKAGAAIARGANIAADAAGKAKTAVATSVSGAAVLGSNVLVISQNAVANADEIVSVFYWPIGVVMTTAS